MYMVNREKTRGRADWHTVRETAYALEALVERWAPFVEQYRSNEDSLIEDYFDAIAKGDVHSDDDADDGEMQVSHEYKWNRIYGNRSAALAEYVESDRWYRENYPVAHAAFREHIAGLVGGTEWRYPEAANLNQLD